MAARRSARIDFAMDLTELAEFRRHLPKVSPETIKAIDKAARRAVRPLRDTIRREAPARRTPKIVRSRGSTTGQRIEIRGWWARPRLPSNIAFLLQNGHRMPWGGRSRANPFVRRGLAKGLDDYRDAYKNAINSSIRANLPKGKWVKF